MTAVDIVRPRARAFWSDLRFLLGVFLVLLSVAGVWAVVAAARQTAPVFTAARTIVPGQTVTGSDLRVVEVALGGSRDGYASPGSLRPGAVALRTIAAGELVPRSALGTADNARTTTVVLRSSLDVPHAVREGSTVEVWAARPVDRSTYEAPRVLVSAATVVSVGHDDAVIGDNGTRVELAVDRDEVAAALAAISDGSRLSVVPVAGEAP